MAANDTTTTELEYPYEYTHKGKPVRLGVHLAEEEGVAVPRVHWHISDSKGSRGTFERKYGGAMLYLDVEREETAHFSGEHVDRVPLPRDIADELHHDAKEMADQAQDN